MARLRWVMMIVCVSALALVTASASASSGPWAACPIGSGHGYGYTRLTSLQVKGGISCSVGDYLAHKHGHVARSYFTCHAVRLDRTARYYDERVTCTMAVKGPAPMARWTFRQKH